jgi:type I restriction enzyme M protein
MKSNNLYSEYNIQALTEPLEPYTRQVIESRLSLLGYDMDESHHETCNVYRERAKTVIQDKLLNGKNPDFLIYEGGTDRILAVIEAKRPSATLDKAIAQAIDYYANPLEIPLVFVFNSSSFYACSRDRKPLKIDNIEISDFVDEKTLIKLIESNCEIETVPEGFTLSREDLLKKFKRSNNILRKAGLRDGYERFSVFADLMFLKLKNDFTDIGEVADNNETLDEKCNWDILMSKTPSRIGASFDIRKSEVGTYLNDTIRPRLKKTYGDVFESTLNIEDESILIQLIEEIDTIDFTSIDSDVKGDAFEFFLRKVTNGNKDLGEYYTPRHIVKMMVRLVSPTYGETIYDPCSGTGGFLLECFKYLRQHTDIYPSTSDNEEVIKEKEKKRTFIREKSIYGREITSTARIAKMNMILFGDGHTNIKQMDCLSQVVKEKYTIAISNIPYSQKVEYGNLYEFKSNKGDSIFMQHIWQSIKKGGRMAVVVPDTFLYNDKYVNEIREKIIKESSRLVIISLPRGVFNPYTPTKTSIIFACKRKEREDHFNKAFFYIVRNDGFELGARRRPLSGRSDCTKFFMSYNDDEEFRITEEPDSINVDYADIERNDYSLFPFCFMEHKPTDEKAVQLEDYIKERKSPFKLSQFSDKDESCAILSVTKNGIYIGETYSANEIDNLNQKYKRVHAGDFVYNPHRINVGSIGVVPQLHKNMFVSNIYPVFTITNKELPEYFLLKQLKSPEHKVIINDYCLGGARADLKLDWLKKIRISIPSEAEREDVKKKSEELNEAFNKYIEKLNDIMK